MGSDAFAIPFSLLVSVPYNTTRLCTNCRGGNTLLSLCGQTINHILRQLCPTVHLDSTQNASFRTRIPHLNSQYLLHPLFVIFCFRHRLSKHISRFKKHKYTHHHTPSSRPFREIQERRNLKRETRNKRGRVGIIDKFNIIYIS